MYIALHKYSTTIQNKITSIAKSTEVVAATRFTTAQISLSPTPLHNHPPTFTHKMLTPATYTQIPLIQQTPAIRHIHMIMTKTLHIQSTNLAIQLSLYLNRTRYCTLASCPKTVSSVLLGV